MWVNINIYTHDMDGIGIRDVFFKIHQFFSFTDPTLKGVFSFLLF